jgi:hypothetical protein
MAAIEVCKKQILETPEKSDRRKNMVSKLINLRIRLQDLRDKQERPGEVIYIRFYQTDFKDGKIEGLQFISVIFTMKHNLGNVCGEIGQLLNFV